MEPTFDVRSIAEELLTLFEGWTLHLNRRTGELLSIPEGATVVGEAIEEDVLRVQGPDWLALPDRFDIHPWSIMARFAASREGERRVRAKVT